MMNPPRSSCSSFRLFLPTAFKEFQAEDHSFQDLCQAGQSIYSIFFVNLFLSIFIYSQTLPPSHTHEDQFVLYLNPAEIIFTAISFLSGWSLCYSVYRSISFHRLSQQRVFTLSVTILLGLELIRKSYEVHIHHLSSSIIYSPKSYGHPTADVYAQLILVPLTLLVLTREYRLSLLFLIVSVILISISVSMSFVSAVYSPIKLLILIVCLLPVLLLDDLRHRLRLFRAQQQQPTQDQQCSGDGGQQMRHIIANVAHDLKTVS